MKDPIFQRFIEVQFQLLNCVKFDDIQISEQDKLDYELEIQRVCGLNLNDFSSIPAHLRVMMAMSLRDSSFIISFKPNTDDCIGEWNYVTLDDILYYYKINIVDLDVKPIQNLPRYLDEIKLHG